MKAVIIGSGVAGLTAGAKLAEAGHQVCIYEQYHRPGGVTAGYEHAGFHWELGQLIIEGLGLDEPLGKILAELGVVDQISTIIDDRGYVFPDFELRKPDQYEDPKWRIKRLIERFPQDAEGLERYWRDYMRFTNLMTLGRRLEKVHGVKKLVLQSRLYLKLLPFLPRLKWNAKQLMDDYFQSHELQCVFISILADFFTPPSQFPGLGVFALNPEAVYDKRMSRELAKDTIQLYHYSIRGGMRSLVDALVFKIESSGGHIYTHSPISRILIESGKVTGVELADGSAIMADVVIASGGVKETFQKLVGEENLTKEFLEKVNNQPLMDSIFMLHLGIDFDPSPHLHGAVTYFYGTYDIEGGLQKAKSGIYHEGADGFVVHVPSLHFPEMAPDGHHAMTIYTICPDTLDQGTWADHKEEFAEALISYAEKYIPNLGQHIKVCQIMTPEDFRRRTYLEHHAFGGLSPIMNTVRVPYKTPIEGLWFIGAQSESGGGVNNVMPAAYKVAQMIAKDYQGKRKV